MRRPASLFGTSAVCGAVGILLAACSGAILPPDHRNHEPDMAGWPTIPDAVFGDFDAAPHGNQCPDGGCEDAGPVCGNGRIDPGEACDDRNADSGDGCSGDCKAIERDYACPTPGAACVSTVRCGDGTISGTETCDDGNDKPGDGCDAVCHVESGWACPDPGRKCVAAKCGDGIVAGKEECDDGDTKPGDGCDASCHLEDGWVCPPGEDCRKTVCGDGKAEGKEACDDGNNDLGDGCTPFCVREPDCSAGACTSTCGDGIRLPGGGEACEDGNTRDGDGCSSDCKVEPGYYCDDVVVGGGNTLDIPIVIRDFSKAHPDFEYVTGDDRGIVLALLGSDGKPVYAHPCATAPCTPTTTLKANFDQWYRDVPGTNRTILQTLTLTKQGGVFQYANSNFFPIDNLGFGKEGNNHNFHFTSEVRYWFEYKGGEKLDFTGDDDVFVFVNQSLAVDLGGVHGAESGNVTLDAGKATAFGLTLGKIYQLVVFQAERHTTESNYKLTLSNFTNTRSSCTTRCGDGIVAGDETCDDGRNDGSYGSCTPDCQRGPRCGDGMVQTADGEACDDGVNLTPYLSGSGTSGSCAPGCKQPSRCGDGVVDSLFGEQCDDGNNPGGYGECAPTCVFGPRCGDGVIQPEHESCDDGNRRDGDGCSSTCQSEIG